MTADRHSPLAASEPLRGLSAARANFPRRLNLTRQEGEDAFVAAAIWNDAGPSRKCLNSQSVGP